MIGDKAWPSAFWIKLDCRAMNKSACFLDMKPVFVAAPLLISSLKHELSSNEWPKREFGKLLSNIVVPSLSDDISMQDASVSFALSLSSMNILQFVKHLKSLVIYQQQQRSLLPLCKILYHFESLSHFKSIPQRVVIILRKNILMSVKVYLCPCV